MLNPTKGRLPAPPYIGVLETGQLKRKPDLAVLNNEFEQKVDSLHPPYILVLETAQLKRKPDLAALNSAFERVASANKQNPVYPLKIGHCTRSKQASQQ